jgi:WD40 repeat protein
MECILEQTLDPIHKRNGTIVSLKYHVSPTGAPWLICASSDNIIVFWNLRTLREDRIMLGSGRELIHCQFVNIPTSHFLEPYKQNEFFSKIGEMDHSVQEKSLFKQLLLLRSDPSCVLLQMSPTQTTASILNGHTDTVLSADCTANGCWIVSGSKDHTVRIWSTLIKQCVAIYDIHAAPVTNVKVNVCVK